MEIDLRRVFVHRREAPSFVLVENSRYVLGSVELVPFYDIMDCEVLTSKMDRIICHHFFFGFSQQVLHILCLHLGVYFVFCRHRFLRRNIIQSLWVFPYNLFLLNEPIDVYINVLNTHYVAARLGQMTLN